ncbi:hypothetical protein CIHG_08341 [Coccidioides immitis H538.4]|uniref:Uncharacterized protein n=3 Tax=Coccidioides immitis TaxID=5501 RepID=A0A0J8TTD7_COCIT|nr:hypothetical protein CIRG_06394 [Coccidioides immitis RMSCC 2394]KMU77057.1 hypothetical protein CISG_06292 [Coccidioides immitis RMSCC 3703]KMU90452.1 hypothetical protein CIHG_08341 [Coccidioides immitis H538.4]
MKGMRPKDKAGRTSGPWGQKLRSQTRSKGRRKEGSATQPAPCFAQSSVAATEDLQSVVLQAQNPKLQPKVQGPNRTNRQTSDKERVAATQRTRTPATGAGG